MVQQIAVSAQIEQHVTCRGGQSAGQRDGIAAIAGQEVQACARKCCSCSNCVPARSGAGQHMAAGRKRAFHLDIRPTGSGDAQFKIAPSREPAIDQVNDLGRGCLAVGKIKNDVPGRCLQCAGDLQCVRPTAGPNFDVASAGQRTEGAYGYRCMPSICEDIDGAP